ncbi:MAG: proA [Propionibacteriaceae bacterium]|nr:proA [Propionibacteriaceae bacterium]
MTVQEQAQKARTAALTLSSATRATKDAALLAMADALAKSDTAILEANARDVSRAEANGTSAALIDRLRLTPDRIAGMVEGLRELAALPDPVGDVVRGWTNANGVQVRQVRVPFGVVGIIYEARPNVTADAGGICLKSGNAALLRGSSSAAQSNAAVVDALQTGLVDAGLPAEAIQLVPGPREVTNELMAARGLVDVLIPRGGAGLIDNVVRNSQVPVIETGVGNCHVFVDAAADEQMALDEKDFAEEYLSLDLAAAVVDSLDSALQHIRRYSTGHTETIVTESQTSAARFTAEVDAAAVLVNASGRFVDGGEFGFGAEIGISTQKLHARGPMGLPEMTSTKYVVTGSGQVRQ